MSNVGKESFLDVTREARDYLGAICLALTIKKRLRESCGECVTASIGIAPNKLVAKAASERMKPDGLTVVQPKDVIPFLDSARLEDVCGIGPRIKSRLDELGVSSLKHLREFPVERLIAEFKSYGYWLHEAAFGRDNSAVLDEKIKPKSVGHSYTLPKNTKNACELKRYLLTLSDKVAWRLRRDGCLAACVSAYVRFGDFSGAGAERRFREPTANGLALFNIGWGLIKPFLASNKPVRLVGICASRLLESHAQPSLFRKDRKIHSVFSALDRLQFRYGDRAWTRASLIKTTIQPRSSGFAYDHEL